MITAFNRKQTLLGILNLIIGVTALVVASTFFYFGSQFVLGNFGVDNARPISLGITALGLAVVIFSGISLHRKGKGNYSYSDSDLMPGFQMETAGSTVVDFYTNRVTAPAHALTQIFLCAPLQILKGIDRFRSRIAIRHGLEQDLANLLGEIDAQDKWQTVSDYPERAEALQYLIRMDAIQFSARTGKLRAKK